MELSSGGYIASFIGCYLVTQENSIPNSSTMQFKTIQRNAQKQLSRDLRQNLLDRTLLKLQRSLY